MPKYRKKPVVIEATQFNYIDNIDGPKTCELAKSFGLSRNGPSLLWEIKTAEGWRIMYSGDWSITDAQGQNTVASQTSLKPHTNQPLNIQKEEQTYETVVTKSPRKPT